MAEREFDKLFDTPPLGLCDCGHWSITHGMGTRHADRMNIDTLDGQGACFVAGCDCPQFSGAPQ